jgi:DnaJ-class molecular chaperone
VLESRLVEIRPGYSGSTKLTVERAGNESPGDGVCSNLVLKIKELEHPKFKRIGDDLIYTAEITLSQAINAEPVEVVTLDGRKLFVSFDEIIKYLIDQI